MTDHASQTLGQSDFDYDLFVIGAGSGGVRAARIAAASGARTAIAEEFRIGGTCVIRGCVPKKLMVYASEYGRNLFEARGYGWDIAPAKLDWQRLMGGVRSELTRLSAIYEKNLNNSAVTIFRERAIVEGPQTVRLTQSNQLLRCAKILIATGGQPWRPLDLPGQELAITSNEIFDVETPPKSVLIAGGGYIAVEFACIFNGLGIQTTLVYRGDKILRGFDDEIRDHVQDAMQKQGILIKTNCVFERIEQSGDELSCRLTNGETLRQSLILLAIGRQAHSRNLGLEKAGVLTKSNNAIIVDEYSKTTAPYIWAVGDVTDRINLTPVAIREGHCFADTEFGGKPRTFDHSDIATAVFTRPPIGTVGLSEAQALAEYPEIHVYRTRFRPMKYILAGVDERMLMKLIVRASDDVVVGCQIVGPDAPEMIQLVAIAIKARLTKAQFDDTCAVHPTAAEELVTLGSKIVVKAPAAETSAPS